MNGRRKLGIRLREAKVSSADHIMMHPMRRVGAKGEGARISWDEALGLLMDNQFKRGRLPLQSTSAPE
jgi:anaerobic selenocysteine-containing dehydrogenase